MTFRAFLISCCISVQVMACAEEHFEIKTTNMQLSTMMIDWYKAHIAPLNILGCDYYPSCSQYTKQAIQKHGFIKGWLLGCDRLLRCNSDHWIYPQIQVDGEIKKYNPVP